nr:calponin homology domain-containing protein DDB_G0272472-like isoform X1 [Malus domestica]
MLSTVTKRTKMATTSRSLYRRLCLRSFSTSTKPTHHNSHQQNHQYMEPNSFIGCWEAPKDPKEAEAKLAHLRRDYTKQVKEVRKEYIKEVELMRLDKLLKDEARKEALRLQNEERKRLKAEAAKVRAQQREVAEQEFQQTLLKERAEKLENWKMKEKRKEEMKKDEKELLRRKSSMWINEQELEKKILEAIVDTTPL